MNESAIPRRALVAVGIGNVVEWYDFAVYAFFASYIAGNFFVAGDSTQALIATFLVFGAGFVARPIGSLVGGLVGDRSGRKAALMLSLATMGAGMVAIAAAPPVTAVGVVAPMVLLAGRLLQGFSVGAEIGAAAAFLVEQAPPGRRSGYAAWLQATIGLASLLSAVVGLAITSVLSDAAVAAWAWRIPFALGLVIIPIALYLRRTLPESAAFRTGQPATTIAQTLRTLFVGNRRNLVAGFLFSIPWHLSIYCFVIFGPTYYRIAAGLTFPSQEAFSASVAGNACLVVGCLAFGRLADRAGRLPVIMVSAAVLTVLPFGCLLLLHAVPTFPMLLAVHSVLCLAVSALAGVAPSTLPTAFPVAVRATGVSISFGMAAIVAAAFTPALLTWATGAVSVYAPAMLAAVGAIISLLATPWLFTRIRALEPAKSAP
ncbi:MFS transporter [Catellatospora methionotrophica]|uniref:MFS transporter n=1 Tax=Catellatospora methionotrophica TaxID=121620 RepID=A0A8J3LLX7_9ACTN|nr:MFS transporter [Catellatospora methionotrophica]GIG15075.1 MFS transporter [Catellatospora methionotrophica]